MKDTGVKTDAVQQLIRKRRVVLCLFALLCVYGYFSWKRLSLEAYPDIADVTSQVVTQVPGLAAEEVEQQITIPLERALNGLPGMHVMRSKSTFGLSIITVVFQDGTEDYWSRQRVQERLAEVDLPYGAVPGLDPLTSPVGEIYRYIVESDRHSLRELTDLQHWVIIPRIKQVPGVADVTNFGGITTQFQVEIDPSRLEQYGVTLAQVTEAIANNNANTGGSMLTRGELSYVVRGIGFVEDLQDLGNIVVCSRAGVPVFLRDLGELKYGNLERKGVLGYTDRQRDYPESLEGIVLLLKHGNPSEVLAGVHEAVAELNGGGLPEGVRIHAFLDRTALVETTLDTVSHTLFMGMALVIVVLILFLGSWRGALLVSLTIPAALLIAFVLMRWTDVPANLLSLGAVDFGIIVDGAIVMLETVLKKREDHPGDPLEEGSIAARIREAGRPILFSTVVIITAYLPLFAFERVERKLFTPMAFTMSYAMLGALLVSLLLIPGMAYAIYRKPAKVYCNRWLERLGAGYARILQRQLARPWKTVAAGAAALAAGMVLSVTVGKDFLPELDEGSLWLQVSLPPGISMEQSKALSDTLRAHTMKYPEVTYIMVQAGRNDDGTDPFTPSHFEVSVGLKPYREWPRGKRKSDLVRELAAEYAALPGFSVGFSQPMIDGVMDKMAGAHSELVVKVYGDDFREMRRIAGDIVRVLEQVPGAADVDIDQEPPLPQLQVVMDRDAIARYGLNVSDVSELIEVAIGGKAVGQVYQGDRQYDVTCKYREDARDTPEKMAGLMLTASTGAAIPLSQVADIRLTLGESTITREMNRRHLTVKLNLRGRDLSSFLKEAQQAIERDVAYDGSRYAVKWGGAFENQRRAYSRLAVIVPLALACMFLLLYFTFGKFRQAVLVLSVVPLALFGGMLALNLRGMTLNVSSAVGFIAMFGLSVQNGIILVSQVNALRRKGKDLYAAVQQGARQRFRPILMTSVTTVLGLFPASLATGIGSDVQRPLATVIVYGLIFSTAVSLFLLPVAYALVERRFLPGDGLPGGNGLKPASFRPIGSLLLCLCAGCVFAQPGVAQSGIPNGVSSDGPAEGVLSGSPEQALSFEACLYRVYRGNLRYLADRMNVGMAEAEAMAARVWPDPSVDFSAGKEQFSAGISWTLELGKRHTRVAEARSRVEYEALVFEQGFQDLRAGAAELFLDAMLQRELLRAKEEAYRYMLRLNRSDSLRCRAGEITENDWRQSRLEAVGLLNEVYDQQAEYLSALAALNACMGLPPDSLFFPAGNWEGMERDFTLAGLLETGLDRRRDLAAAARQVETEHRAYDRVRADRRPDIGLSLSYERGWDGVLPRMEHVSLGVSVPLVLSAANRGSVQGARLRMEQAAVLEQEMKLQVQREIAQGWHRFEAARKKVLQYRSGVLAEARQVLDGTVYRYTAGEADILEVLIAQRSYNELQQRYLETMKGYVSALVSLELACGIWDIRFE